MPQVLQSLLRSALLGAGRVVFILGPADAETREANARVVLSQEAKSLMRAYEAFEKFKHSGALIPPDHVLRAQRERSREIESWGSPIGEEKTLLRMTDAVIKTLASRGYPPETLPIMAEQITWIFHVYSGVSHGFAWPRLVPGSQSMPGALPLRTVFGSVGSAHRGRGSQWPPEGRSSLSLGCGRQHTESARSNRSGGPSRTRRSPSTPGPPHRSPRRDPRASPPVAKLRRSLSRRKPWPRRMNGSRPRSLVLTMVT